MTPPALLERDAPLSALVEALAAAEDGHGSTALISGEAGIGKTSLVEAFVGVAARRGRLLTAACDDLVTPRTLGPLWDAAPADGPLAEALASDREVFAALLAELARERPTVLVVEDAHWADDATIDVLGYAARRVRSLGALLVLTVRDEALAPGHPLHRLLGVLAGEPVHRLALSPLSRDAVVALVNGTGRDPDALHALTRGNPFFVAEALAASADEVPASVKDAVLARLRGVSPACQEAVERLSVVPSAIAPGLLGVSLGVLAEAEQARLVEARAGGIAFRHELARRAVEQSLPELRRRLLNAEVVGALRVAGVADRARLLHHAVAAGDVATLLEEGPAAAREAARAGSHRQALAHYETVMPHAALLEVRGQADLLHGYGWELYNAGRFVDAAGVGRRALALYEELGDERALGLCLVRLSRLLFMAGETDEAEAAALRAVDRLGDNAYATLYLGAILALSARHVDAMAVLERADKLALEASRPDLGALCLNYLAIARFEAGEVDRGLETMRNSIALATAGGHFEEIARGYTNLVELLARVGELDELERWVRDGLAFARERGFWSHAFNMEVHERVLQLRRGDWETAESGLRGLVDAAEGDTGFLSAYSVPWLGRLLARRGDPSAGPLLADAWARAQRARTLVGLAYAGLARVEWAWLTGDTRAAREVAAVLLPRVSHPGGAWFRGELLRYLARAGVTPADEAGAAGEGAVADGERAVAGGEGAVAGGKGAVAGRDGAAAGGEPVAGGPGGLPPAWAAGLGGEWRSAAAQWRRAGDPYEAALELALSGEPDAIADGLDVLDRLGAAPAAELARAGLRERGARVPRGPNAATRGNPAGLTKRQLAVLDLVREGLTNAEIADRLVLSVRTVDHHVAAILLKLGVKTRHEAAATDL